MKLKQIHIPLASKILTPSVSLATQLHNSLLSKASMVIHKTHQVVATHLNEVMVNGYETEAINLYVNYATSLNMQLCSAAIDLISLTKVKTIPVMLRAPESFYLVSNSSAMTTNKPTTHHRMQPPLTMHGTQTVEQQIILLQILQTYIPNQNINVIITSSQVMDNHSPSLILITIFYKILTHNPCLP